MTDTTRMGVTVTTAVDIDWDALGRHLASINSDEQAAFLNGFAGGLHGLGAVASAHQIDYIAKGLTGYAAWLAFELSAATR